MIEQYVVFYFTHKADSKDVVFNFCSVHDELEDAYRQTKLYIKMPPLEQMDHQIKINGREEWKVTVTWMDATYLMCIMKV